MKEHFRGVVWPRDSVEGRDGVPAYRYAIVGLLITDEPIEGLDPSQTVIDSLIEVSGDKVGFSGAIARADKFESPYGFANAVELAANLDMINIMPIGKQFVPAPSKTITIMPDHGNSPYAWLKPASDTTSYVGVSVGGFLCKPSDFEISDQLHGDFVSWCSVFERDTGAESFDWSGFHAAGIELAKELKKQVGPNFRVVYSKPVEDPAHDISALTEIV